MLILVFFCSSIKGQLKTCFTLGERGYSYHMILKEEQRSFSQWINANLSGMEELAHLLPLKDDGADVYDKIGDGILLW